MRGGFEVEFTRVEMNFFGSLNFATAEQTAVRAH
jgi:hypothetical protein